jgi:DNA-directed RNA polymerase
MDLVKEQERLEGLQLTEARAKVIKNYLNLVGTDKGNVTAEGIALQKLGIERLAGVIKEYFDKPLRGTVNRQRKPLLSYKGRETDLAFLIISSVISSVMKRPASAQQLVGILLRNLKNDIMLETFQEQEPKLFAYIEYEYKKRGQDYINSRKKRLAQLLVEQQVEEIDTTTGVAMMELLVGSNLGLIEKFRRHTTNTKRAGKSPLYFFKLTEDAEEVVGNIQQFLTELSITYKPLVIPPREWGEGICGGYHHSDCKGFIKLKNNKQRGIYGGLIKEGLDLSRLYSVVNKIQATSWRVNEWMFDVVDNILENNVTDYSKPKDNPKCIAGLPYQEYVKVDDLVKPEKFGKVFTDARGFPRHENRADYTAYYKRREDVLAKLEANNSRRIIYAVAFDIAKQFKKYDKFYFSYKSDFRGRLYPVQQVFNPQATSNVKALMEFGEGVESTVEGIYWLKVALANARGYDKLPYEERVAYVDANIKEILRSAESPLENVSFWTEADEPLMFLSGCKALSDALDGKLVHYPVPLDATCSGIQIYSGLLMDEEGARAVNVINNETGRPADIYKEVADVVERRLMSGDYPKEFTFTDSEGNFTEVKTTREAQGLRGKVDRKKTKRNVMTQPYSVTQRGMYEQLRELFDEAQDDGKEFWKGEKWVSIKLLTHLNTQAIFEVVKGAIIGQEYIKEITKHFNLSNKPLVWKTPIFGFPVIQASQKRRKKRLATQLGKLQFTYLTGDIDSRKQTSSIAPNFIHSLDATLMLLTVERLAEEYNVTDFALIHDSFAVPCTEVAHLNNAVRDSYVELFMSEPLAEWYEQLQAKLPNVKLQHPDEVMLYTLNIQDVWDSDYIFS